MFHESIEGFVCVEVFVSRKSVKTPLIYALEPRLLFDGDLGADVASSIVYRDGNNDAAFQSKRLL